MKKFFLIIIFALSASIVQAQNVSMEFIPFYHPNYTSGQNINIQRKILQQRDGDLVANVNISDGENLLGKILYKISPTELKFTDSLPVADTTFCIYLLAQDPHSEGNLRVNIEPDGNGGTALRISHFSDDNLVVDHADDVVVPLYDGIAYEAVNCYMIDSQKDLIVKFYTRRPDGGYVCHIARYGLDGTLKHTAELPESQNFISNMNEFESVPKQYYQWKSGSNDNIFLYVLDSLFHLKTNYMFNRVLHDTLVNQTIVVHEEFWFQSGTCVIPDGEDVLIAAPYTRDSAGVLDFQERGIAVARYEMRTMQRKALVHFNDWPGPSTDAKIMCFQKTSDGDLYLVYEEPDLEYTPYMVAVKMDRDLNVLWRRYCYEPHSLKYIISWMLYSDILKDDNGNEKGIYIAGYSFEQQTLVGGFYFFFLTDEDINAIGDNGMKVRPYTYYPNPAQDQLRLQYSPDVKPARIELYDLQGRLVYLQSHSLESVEMQGLTAGQYLMKVSLEDGKSYTDKLVKE